MKQQGSCIPLINKRLLTKLRVEIDDISIPLRPEINLDNTLESQIQTQTQSHSNENATILLSTADTSYPSFSYPIFEAKEALLSHASGDDDGDTESTLQVHQKICLPFWKKLGSRQVPRILGLNPEASVEINGCLTKGSSTIQGNNKIMPEYGRSAEESVSCARVTFSPILCPWRCFTIEEIRDATKNFHAGNLVGKGGFAKVYRGSLPDGQIIAIKKLNQSNTVEHGEKEFLVEIGIMAHVCHQNITVLLGFCLEGGLYLIYNFFPNGSLAGFLHGTRLKLFDWSLRYKVALGIAQGLFYLHEQCRRRIIHRDIKASNILLNGDFEPQISDFGLAKWLPKDWSHHSVSPVEGTIGYLAPEYHKHGIVDEKIDIYSFGVLLLELITGRQPVDNDQQCLVHWARPLLESWRIQDLVDPKLRGCYNHQQMQWMIGTAETCVRQSSISRPPMNQEALGSSLGKYLHFCAY